MKEYNTKQFEFFRDEILGELGWCDEVDASGIDPLEFARNEIKNLRGQVKRLRGSLELRDAAQQGFAVDVAWTCICGATHAEGGSYCDVCGTDRPRH